MATPETVFVTLSKDRFTQGFYRIDGNRIVMTYHDGVDVEPPVTCEFKPGDNVRGLAAALTREIRKKMHTPFDDPIVMPESGIA